MANVGTLTDWLEFKERQSQQCAACQTNTRKDGVYGEQKTENYRATSISQLRSTRRGKDHFRARQRSQPSKFKKLFSYEELIAIAIRSSRTHALTLFEIHAFIADMYPYFKIYPAALKADISKTLSMSNCFAKLETPSGLPEGEYWTLARTSAITTHNEPIRMSMKAKTSSERIGCSYETTHSIATVSMNDRAAFVQPSASKNDIPSIAYSQAKTRRTDYTHDTSTYPRVSVITPAHENQQKCQDEIGIKIGQVFSLNPQSSTVLPTVKPSNLPVRKETIERLRNKITPYHPCTLWVPRNTKNLPSPSSFVSEDKDRYEDAECDILLNIFNLE